MRLPTLAFAGVLTMTFSTAAFALRGFHMAWNPQAVAGIKGSTAATRSCTSMILSKRTSYKHRIPREASYSTTLFASNVPKKNSSNNQDTIDSTGSSESTKTYRLDGRGRGTKIEAITNTGHSLTTDIPKPMGGGDTAAQPVETLLGAWMGCTQATASFVGRQILMEQAKRDKNSQGRRRTEVLLEFINIQASRDERGALELPIRQTPSVPSRLQRITGTIKVSVSPATGTNEPAIVILDPEELDVLKEQTEARCPIANMIVESGCVMDIEWIQ